MEWMTSEIMFYGGIGISVSAVIFGILFLCISQIHKIRLMMQLDREYGENRKKGRK